MPPRYAYWAMLIDNEPMAFHAREKEELLPTFQQPRRTNKDVVMKWFARRQLWVTPEEAHAAGRMARAAGEKRGRDWRPGGQHQDPRERFKKGSKDRDERQKPSDVAQVLGLHTGRASHGRGTTSHPSVASQMRRRNPHPKRVLDHHPGLRRR